MTAFARLSDALAALRGRMPRRFTTGQKVITVYFLMVYVGPLIGNLLLRRHIESSYRIYPLTVVAMLFLLGVYALFMVLTSFDLRILPAVRTPRLVEAARRLGEAYFRGRLVVAVAALILATTYASAGLNPYRYLDTGISESGSPLLLVGNVLRALIAADLVGAMFLSRKEAPRFLSSRYVATLLLGVSLLLLADGTLSTILALITVAFALHPRAFRRVAFSRGSLTWRRVRTGVAIAIVAPLLLFGAWVVGEIIKLTSSDAFSLSDSIRITLDRVTSGPEFFTFFAVYLVERLSIYYYSFLYTMARSWSELNAAYGWSVLLPLKSFLFRFDYLLGGALGLERPPVVSMMQMNYLSLTADPINSRGGSAPGILASFAYALPFPFSLALCALFLAWLSRVTDVLLESGRRNSLSIFGVVTFILFVHTVFQSPFDLLIVVDEAVIFLSVIFVCYGVLRETQLAGQPTGAATIVPGDTAIAGAK